MSPTESSFGFESTPTIEGRFALPASSSTQPYLFSPKDQRSSWTDIGSSSVQGSNSSPVPSSSSLSSPESTTGVSLRPLSFHWDRYENFDEQDEDENDHESQDEADSYNVHEGRSVMSKSAYHQQFEGHHSTVRRRSSFGGGRGNGSRSYDEPYDSLRHGIGLNLSDMNEELEKARSKMIRASRAMKNMDQELEAMQMSIDESKASSASTRSAIEENFWRLECLARTIEKDRQETSKRLQSVGRDCSEAIEAVTNWEVRIDWLERRVDNTSEYVSELVLSEQECMSFIKMIIQQNQRYAMPAISRATERNIKLMAPPRLKEISYAAHGSGISSQTRQPTLQLPSQTPPPLMQPQTPLQSQPSVRHIPISWLLDPIMPPKPPEITEESPQTSEDTPKMKKPAIEPPAELWRDFSRLTTALETGQTRTAFSPFQRTRSRSTGQGALMMATGLGLHSSHGNSSSSKSSTSTSHGSTLFKANLTRRPQVENLSSMPKILPAAVPPTKMPVVKRRSQNLSHLPVHSWLQFQFNKTMTTPNALAQPGSQKKTNVLGFKPITIFQTTV
ncbi:hypothetical protein EDD11_002712 [Mortierella claussenii]|nr:hypothetical protein EDD11_002712 [Mortierella claussenii]